MGKKRVKGKKIKPLLTRKIPKASDIILSINAGLSKSTKKFGQNIQGKENFEENISYKDMNGNVKAVQFHPSIWVLTGSSEKIFFFHQRLNFQDQNRNTKKF